MRICQVCKTANEPLADACTNCNAPLSESDHHIVVEPAFIDDIPSLEEAARYQRANTVTDPEPRDDARTKPAAPSKLSFVVSALSSIAQGKPAANEPAPVADAIPESDVTPHAEQAGVDDNAVVEPSNVVGAAVGHDEFVERGPIEPGAPAPVLEEPARDAASSEVAPPVEKIPIIAPISSGEIARGAEDVTPQPAAEPAPIEVLQRPSAARYRAAVPIEERAAANLMPESSDVAPPVETPRIEMPPVDMPPIEAAAFVEGGAEIPRAPVSAIRPYARKAAPARRPVSRRNIAIAAAFGLACIALLAIVPIVSAMHNGSAVAIATATGTPGAATSGAPDLTTTLATAPASSAPEPTAIPPSAAPKSKPSPQLHAPVTARKAKPIATPHPKSSAMPKPTVRPKPSIKPRASATLKPTAAAQAKPVSAVPKPSGAATPQPSPAARPKLATPSVRPIAFREARNAAHKKPASLTAPPVALAPAPSSVATPPPAAVSQATANQPLVIRSRLGRGNTVSLATGGPSGLGDLQWHKLSADQWQLLTVNGASARRLGTIGYRAFFAITANDLAHYSYEPTALPSISGKDLDGTVLAVRTSGGAYAKVYVQESNYAATVYYDLYPAGSSK